MYIARRKSRGGKRFGFVRMINLEEADRVTQRLNGATLYGSRLVVKIARDKQGRSWKRNPTGKSHSTEYKKTGIGMEDEAVVQKWKKEEKSCEKSDELDEKLTAFHGNGDEESIKKASTLDLDEKVADGNYVGIQRVISVEKAGQVITKADGSDNGLIGVSSNRSGPESPGREVQKWVILVVEIYDRIESCYFSQVFLVVSEWRVSTFMHSGQKLVEARQWHIENSMVWWHSLLSVYIGGFDDEEFAARFYVLVALKVWGESTTLFFTLHNTRRNWKR
ncbi:hypothetical protein V6N11_051193 [Hibiscus sabdariffa]|uniref:RRM domain-containing protein n=1 Tax=Hibiscus sabdariffa TaxID=183260 RepID=A0ABR2A0Q7_9ROSI